MISEISFRRFRALRDTQLPLGRFNLVLGSNGSGKTSLIESLLRLRTLARLPLRPSDEDERLLDEGPEVTFRFNEPFDGLEALMACVSDRQCDLLQVTPLPSGAGRDDWPLLRARVLELRSFALDHRAISARCSLREGAELTPTGGNLAGVLHRLETDHPEIFSAWIREVCRIFPEYAGVEIRPAGEGWGELFLQLRGEGSWIAADQLSQGTLYLLALLALAFSPHPPSLLAIEEIDRGIHPRLLRDVRDTLYRLSHPESAQLTRPPCQVVATTHAPHVLDLFRDHPEEVVISTKTGTAARFQRLVDHPAWTQLAESEGTLGDLWYTGLLGGVPQEEFPT